jgi:hypothetical protein
MPKIFETPVFNILARPALAALFLMTFVHAGLTDDDSAPLALIRSFYVPYLAGDAGPEPKPSTDVIYPHATNRLKHLIDLMNECETKSQGVCNLDFDVIINGEDWDLKGLPKLTAQPLAGGDVEVAARFSGFGAPLEVDYFFVNSGSGWQIDDVTGNGPDDSWRLSTILAHEPD